jgi:mono/diheme cytochrome c family protein
MRWLLRSRLSIVLVFGLVLLALDVGRSIWARTGLAQPSAEYRPDPTLYADLTWPPGADLDSGAPLGARVFARHCAVCHGPNGRGNGPAAPSLFPRPRDFSSGRFKYKSTAADGPPTDEDLLRTVRDGLAASAMPYFAGVVSTEELNAVVAQVKSYSRAFSRPGRPLDIPAWRPFGTLWTRNIAAHPQAGVGAWTDMELERAIRSGVSRDGRQLHWQGMTWDQLSNLDEEDLRAIVTYVRLLPPVNRAVPLPRPPAADDCETDTYYLEKSDQPGRR